MFSESTKNILDRFNLSENFVGSSVLAIGTSLAEAINSITAGIYDKKGSSKNRANGQSNGGSAINYSLNSLYNLTGANVIQIVFLSMVSLVIWKKTHFKSSGTNKSEYQKFITSIFSQKTLIWTLATLELITLLCAFIFKSVFEKFQVKDFNFVPLIFLIVWFLYITCMKKKNKNSTGNISHTSNIFSKYSNAQFLSLFSLIFIFFSILAFINFSLVSKFEEVLKIPKNIGLGTLLSIVTSFPEFSSFFFLFKSKNYNLANSGLFGSALFNLTLPFLTQLSKGDWLLKSSTLHSTQITPLIFWLSNVLFINLIFAIGFYVNKPGKCLLRYRGDRRSLVMGATVISSYILSSMIIGCLI